MQTSMALLCGVTLLVFAAFIGCCSAQCENYDPTMYKGMSRIPADCTRDIPSDCPCSWKSGIYDGGSDSLPLINDTFVSCHEGSFTCGHVPLNPETGEVLGNSGVIIGTRVDGPGTT